MSDNPLLQKVGQALQRRGIKLRYVNRLPGDGLELLCSLPPNGDGDWNLLGLYLLLLARNANATIRVGRTMILKDTDPPRMAEGGSIQLWNKLPSLAMVLEAAQKAPRNRQESLVATVFGGDFMKKRPGSAMGGALADAQGSHSPNFETVGMPKGTQ